MKRTAVIMMLVFILCLYGCENSEPPKTERTPDQPATTSAPDTAEATPSSTTDESSPEPVSMPSVNPIKAASIVVNEVNDERGTIYIVQSQLDACNVFYVNDIEMTGNDFGMGTDYMGFTLVEGRVDGISVASYSEMPTSLGLKFGDSVEQMINLYGTEYTFEQPDTEETAYEYKMDDHYFYVDFLDGKVAVWGFTVKRQGSAPQTVSLSSLID